MKIEDVQALALAVPLSAKCRHSSLAGRLARQIVVKILTDDGLTGIGEAFFPRDAPLSVCNLIEHGLKPYLIGEEKYRRVAFFRITPAPSRFHDMNRSFTPRTYTSSERLCQILYVQHSAVWQTDPDSKY